MKFYDKIEEFELDDGDDKEDLDNLLIGTNLKDTNKIIKNDNLENGISNQNNNIIEKEKLIPKSNEIPSNNINEIDNVKDKKYDITNEIEKQIIYNKRTFIFPPKQPKDKNIKTYFCMNRRKNELIKKGFFCKDNMKRIIYKKKYYIYQLYQNHSDK